MKAKRQAAWVGAAALIVGWLVLLLVTALGCNGCGNPKPKPHVPVGQVSCDVGCQHAVELGSDVGLELCVRLCRGVAGNNPGYPTCLANAPTRADLDGCQ